MSDNCCVRKVQGVVTTTATNVVIVIAVPTGFTFIDNTRYDVMLNAPVPVAGYNLPVAIEVSGTTILLPVGKLGLFKAIFGQEIHKSRVLHLVFNDTNTFTDVRRKSFGPREVI